MITVLAVDLSLNRTGMAVIKYNEGEFTILEKITVDNTRFRPKESGKKLYFINAAIIRVLKEYDVDYVVRERGFSRFNASTQALFKAAGVYEYSIFEAIQTTGKLIVQADDIAPTTIKKMLTGSGVASKDDVAEAVAEFGPYRNNDESDAVALGVAFIKKITGGVLT